MKNMKRMIVVCLALTLLMIFVPTSAYAHNGKVNNFKATPGALPPTGGNVNISFSVKNECGALASVNQVVLQVGTVAGSTQSTIVTIAHNASKDFTFTVPFAGGDLDRVVAAQIWINFTDGSTNVIPKTITVSSDTDMFYTKNSTIEPEQTVYYVGETVKITDEFKNKTTTTVTNAKVTFYKKTESATVYDKNTISLGTISGKASKLVEYEYTFKAEDIGDLEIASKIKYTVGGVTQEEYNVDHDFVVKMPEVTPTPEPTATPDATPAPTPEPTPDPTPETMAFTAQLTAQSTQVTPGENVMLDVLISNTGNAAIPSVQIMEDDKVVGTGGSIAVGGSAKISIVKKIDESMDVYYVVKTGEGSQAQMVYTNIVNIQVQDDDDVNGAQQAASTDSGGDDTQDNTLVIVAIGIGGLVFIGLIVLIAVVAKKS